MTLDPITQKLTELYFETQKQLGYLAEQLGSLEKKIHIIQNDLELYKTLATPLVTQEFNPKADPYSPTTEEETNLVPSSTGASNVTTITPRKKFYQSIATEGPKIA